MTTQCHCDASVTVTPIETCECCECCSAEPAWYTVTIGPVDGSCCEFKVTPEQAAELAAVALPQLLVKSIGWRNR